jgi:hypothetical protein
MGKIPINESCLTFGEMAEGRARVPGPLFKLVLLPPCVTTCDCEPSRCAERRIGCATNPCGDAGRLVPGVAVGVAALDDILSGVNAPACTTDDACEIICGVSCTDKSLSRSCVMDDAEDWRDNAESEGGCDNSDPEAWRDSAKGVTAPSVCSAESVNSCAGAGACVVCIGAGLETALELGLRLVGVGLVMDAASEPALLSLGPAAPCSGPTLGPLGPFPVSLASVGRAS